MTLISNYHTHNLYCDGNNTVEEMIQSAIEQELIHFGISSHAPIPGEESWTMDIGSAQEYLNEIDVLKRKYAECINLYASMEIDFFSDIGINLWARPYLEKLDYYIGSVHAVGSLDKGTLFYVDYKFDDFANGIETNYNGDIKKAVLEYYTTLKNMILDFQPPIIGHFDIIKKNNVDNYFFDESDRWYKDIVKDVISLIESSKCIVEVNTGGIQRYRDDLLYPSADIIYEMRKRDIPITVNTDSHDNEDLRFGYDETCKLLKDIGYRKIKMLTKAGWEDYTI